MIFDIFGETPFEEDLNADSRILELVQERDFAVSLYRSLCNSDWYKIVDDTSELQFSASFRYAAGFVAYLRRGDESYLDFYLSGGESNQDSRVTDELNRLGWYLRK